MANSILSVELRDITSIKPYEKNPRLNDKAVDAVATSLKEFGFRQPIVVDTNSVIIAGHTRYKAALKLGLQKIPVHIATDLSPEQVKAYRIADNKTGEIAEWNLEILPIEISELQNSGYDLGLLSFSEKELTQLLKTDLTQGLTDPDDVPKPPENIVTQKGDVWILGDHRLLCGDCTQFASFDTIFGESKADMIFSDLPYNVNYGAAVKNKHQLIRNDNLGSEFKGFLTQALTNILKFNQGAIYVCMSSSELHTLYDAFIAAGGKWSTFIIWSKNSFTMGRSDYQRQYEPILYGWNQNQPHYWCGARNQSDIWECNKPVKNDLHPTMKPVELVVRAIQNSSKPGEIVLDTFGGSGSTLIASEQTGRRCFMMEIEEYYCDVIVKRWEDFTGKKAEHIFATKNN
jgi:DNA modification methylase